MKVLIAARTNAEKDVYELKRLRKNLKGACEFANIPYVVNYLNDYDIVHVLDLNQDLIINDAIDSNKPVVISALMAESDADGRMCDYSRKGVHLKLKAKKTLSQASLIIVPNQSCKEFLASEGIKNSIEVVPSGVNVSRFQAINEIELTLFRKYFGIAMDTKVVLCVGQYDDNDETTKVTEIAKKCPNYTFVYLGKAKNKFGWTPLDYARTEEIRAYLKSQQ